MSVGYPYSEGDRLLDRNTYFYSAWGGQPFIEAWRQSRLRARDELLQSRVEPGAPEEGGSQSPTGQLLDALLVAWSGESQIDAEPRHQALMLARRFELSRRVHRAYDVRWRPCNECEFHELGLYVRLAELMLHGWQRERDLRLANVAMKCIDTLVSVRTRLASKWAIRLAAAIEAEQAMVTAIAAQSEQGT
jgi:hypothetical protein